MHHLCSFTKIKMFLRVAIPTLIITSLLGMVTPSLAAASTLMPLLSTELNCTVFNTPYGSTWDGDSPAQGNDAHLPLAREDGLTRKKCEEIYKALVQTVNRLKELIQKRKACANHPAECRNDKLNQINEAISKEKLKYDSNLGQYRKCREKFSNLREVPPLP